MLLSWPGNHIAFLILYLALFARSLPPVGDDTTLHSLLARALDEQQSLKPNLHHHRRRPRFAYNPLHRRSLNAADHVHRAQDSPVWHDSFADAMSRPPTPRPNENDHELHSRPHSSRSSASIVPVGDGRDASENHAPSSSQLSRSTATRPATPSTVYHSMDSSEFPSTTWLCWSAGIDCRRPKRGKRDWAPRLQYHWVGRERLALQVYGKIKGNTLDDKFKHYFEGRHDFRPGDAWKKLPKKTILMNQIREDLWHDKMKPIATKRFRDKAYNLHFKGIRLLP